MALVVRGDEFLRGLAPLDDVEEGLVRIDMLEELLAARYVEGADLVVVRRTVDDVFGLPLEPRLTMWMQLMSSLCMPTLVLKITTCFFSLSNLSKWTFP